MWGRGVKLLATVRQCVSVQCAVCPLRIYLTRKLLPFGSEIKCQLFCQNTRYIKYKENNRWSLLSKHKRSFRFIAMLTAVVTGSTWYSLWLSQSLSFVCKSFSNHHYIRKVAREYKTVRREAPSSVAPHSQRNTNGLSSSLYKLSGENRIEEWFCLCIYLLWTFTNCEQIISFELVSDMSEWVTVGGWIFRVVMLVNLYLKDI